MLRDLKGRTDRKSLLELWRTCRRPRHDYIDIVERRAKYFHPVGHGYRKEPPNYIAFRYHSQLQSIHHIESFVVSENIGRDVLRVEGPDDPHEHFIYELGPPIRPPTIVKNGPSIKRNSRVEAMLDLLLTSETLTEAWQKTNRRLANPTSEEGDDLNE